MEQRKVMAEGIVKECNSTLVSRNITVCGRRTSVRLEPEMWRSIKDIALRENCTIHDICSLISMRKKENTSLTAAIRVFLMLYYRAASTEEGHQNAGHGDFVNMLRRARITEEHYAHFKSFQNDEAVYGESFEGNVSDFRDHDKGGYRISRTLNDSVTQQTL